MSAGFLGSEYFAGAGVFTAEELGAKMQEVRQRYPDGVMPEGSAGGGADGPLSVGDRVWVREQFRRHRRPYSDTLLYPRQCGRGGTICGAFRNPEELAFGRDGTRNPALPCPVPTKGYLGGLRGHEKDTIDIEIFESWLNQADGSEGGT